MGKSKWIKCISTHGNIRGVAIQATQLVREVAERHEATALTAQGLGEAVIGGLLVASYCKAGEHINLNIRGSGHYQQALVDAYPDGSFRGYVVSRDNPFLLRESGEETGPWGAGLLSILRTKPDQDDRQPYIGTVPLLTGHLAKDLTFYWAQSEQVPSSVGIVVDMRKGKVAAAGGFLIQAMPGASMAEISEIEQHIFDMSDLDGMAKKVSEDADPLMLISGIFQSTAFVVLEDRELKFKCTCSWERVERALSLVGTEELMAMLKEDNRATVKCDFCNKSYEVDAAALQTLIAKTASGSSRNPA